MLVRLNAAALQGVDAVPVTVEVRVDRGIHFLMVGLPDSAVRESQQRIKSAIEHLGYRWPGKGITINLAPAGLRKEGAAYDLPLALGILAASDQMDAHGLDRLLSMGELALDGSLRPVRGALALAHAGLAADIECIILPSSSAEEAALLEQATVFGARHLGEVIDHVTGSTLPQVEGTLQERMAATAQASLEPLARIRGQERGLRAMTVAAAGGHNVCMVGPPGAGKTMLAHAMVGLLPPLEPHEALAVNRIHSVSRTSGQTPGFVLQRPFRSPHHTISDVALVGGGSDPRPGEISLAHAGVLFLDELPEMPRHVLEVLRQPLESREIVISRARSTVTFPADFQLVAAMNPCPCGRYSADPDKRRLCTCSRHARLRYMERVSGPLLDRMDLQLSIGAVPTSDLLPLAGAAGRQAALERLERARQLREQVRQARILQGQRNPAGVPNNRLDGEDLHEAVQLNREGRDLLSACMERLHFSARAYTRILRMARTMADLAGEDRVSPDHLAEAISFRRQPSEDATTDDISLFG